MRPDCEFSGEVIALVISAGYAQAAQRERFFSRRFGLAVSPDSQAKLELNLTS
jgi:hypothetical protein